MWSFVDGGEEDSIYCSRSGEFVGDQEKTRSIVVDLKNCGWLTRDGCETWECAGINTNGSSCRRLHVAIDPLLSLDFHFGGIDPVIWEWKRSNLAGISLGIGRIRVKFLNRSEFCLRTDVKMSQYVRELLLFRVLSFRR